MKIVVNPDYEMTGYEFYNGEKIEEYRDIITDVIMTAIQNGFTPLVGDKIVVDQIDNKYNDDVYFKITGRAFVLIQEERHISFSVMPLHELE